MNEQDTSSGFLLFHTYANHIADAQTDYQAAAELVTSQGLFNGMLFWVDHQKEKITLPPIEWFKENDLAVMFEFYTNDHYAVPCARTEGFGDDLTAYNEHWVGLILEYLQGLGPGRSYWGLGHEHYDSFDEYPRLLDNGTVAKTRPTTPQEGLSFFNEWVSTNLHQVHWGPHRYATAEGFVCGYMTDQPDTLEFLRRRSLQIPHGLVVGGVHPYSAAYEFELFPDQEGFWWECQHPGVCAPQVGMCFLRGAALQYQRRIMADIAPYGRWRAKYEISGTAPQCMTKEDNTFTTLFTCYDDQGRQLAYPSESSLQRAWMSLWTSGVDQMIFEDSISTHLNGHGSKLELSALGRAHKAFADLSLRDASDRGELIRTGGVVLPFLHGMSPPQRPGREPWPEFKKPWHGLEPTEGHWDIAHFFDAAFPGHGTVPPWPYPDSLAHRLFTEEGLAHYARFMKHEPDLRALEERSLVSSRWGDGLDVLLDNVSPDVLQKYPCLVVLGDYDALSPLVKKLPDYVESGGRALVTASFPGLGAIGVNLGAGVSGRGPLRLSGRERMPRNPHDLYSWEEYRDVKEPGYDPQILETTSPFTLSTVEVTGKHEVLAVDADGRPLLVEISRGSGMLWVLAANHLVRDESAAAGFPEFVVPILDQFFAPTTLLDIYGQAVQWNVSRNKQGLRVYLANHSPVDVLPRITLHPGKCGMKTEENAGATEYVTGSTLEISEEKGLPVVEVFLRAWGTALLDIPAQPGS